MTTSPTFLRFPVAAAAALALGVATTSPLAAQTTTATAAAAPAITAPHVRIETVGPDGWRMRLGPTNLGSLLESAQGRELWQPQVMPLLGFWEMIAGGAEPFAAAKARLLGYSGRVQFAAWVGKGSLHHSGVVRLALTLESDGRTDMQALAADLRQLQHQATGEWKQRDLAGEKLEVLSDGDDSMTAPQLVGNHIVVAMASESSLAEAFTAAKALLAGAAGKPPAPSTPALRVDVDVKALVAMTVAEGDADDRKAVQVLGLDSLQQVQLSLATAGPHIQVELAQHFAPAPAGFFAAFFPPVQCVPDLRWLATGDGTWRVGHFDWRAFFTTAIEAIQSLSGLAAGNVREGMKEELGIDVIDDLAAHMSTEIAVQGAGLRDFDRADDLAWSIAVRLRDATKFQASLQTLLEHGKPTMTLAETKTIDGVECSRYGILGYDFWLAVGHDLGFALGGTDAEERLTTMLAAAKKATTTPAPANNAFADLAKHLPAGANSEARGDLASVFAVPTEMWWMLLSEMVPVPRPHFAAGDADAKTREQTEALLRQHNLAFVRTASGYEAGVWRWRLYW